MLSSHCRLGVARRQMVMVAPRTIHRTTTPTTTTTTTLAQLRRSHHLLSRDTTSSSLLQVPQRRFLLQRVSPSPSQQQHSTTILRFYFNTRKVIPKKGGAGVTAKTVPVEKVGTSNWKRFAWYVKIVRLPFLIGAIYGLGYQQGIMETARNPLKLQQGFFETMCIDMGVTSGEDIDIISERRPAHVQQKGWMRRQIMITNNSHPYDNDETKERHHPRTETVARIGREIIRAARKHVKEELTKAIERVKIEALSKQSLTEMELHQRIHSDEIVQKWVEAQLRIEGETMDGIGNWQYILVGTSIPNAFVSELLPQRFFVTTGLFDEFVENDDELAMILGHEISHLILGHLSESNQTEFMFRGLELLILAIDPTEGMLSLGIAGFLAQTRKTLLAAFSRENESEADELGCQLAAMACYDTKKGSNVFLKMHNHDEQNGQATKDIMATHPPSKERYDSLVKQSEEENKSKYSYCQRLQNRVVRALTLARPE